MGSACELGVSPAISAPHFIAGGVRQPGEEIAGVRLRAAFLMP